MEKQRISSIKGKLIPIMLLLVVIPLTISLIINYAQSASTAKKNNEQINQQQAKVVQAQVSEMMTENLSAMRNVATNPQVIDFMKNKGDVDEGEKARIISYLQSVDANLADNNSTVLTGSDGFQLVRSKGDCVDVSARDYCAEALAGHVYVSNVAVSKTTGSRIVVPVVPIVDEKNNVLGFIQRNIDISVFYDYVSTSAEEGQTIVITDRSGIVIAHSLHEITADDPDDDRSAEDYFINAHDGVFTTEDRIGGEKMFISSIMEDQTAWIVVVERSYNDSMLSSRIASIVIIVIGLIMLALASVIAITVANSITKPIGVLNKTMQNMADGSFEPITEFKNRNDEFGLMITSTNNLIDSLNTIVADIKESASTVHASATELSLTATQISQTADNVAEAVVEIATGATDQAEEVQNATENTALISNNIQDVTNNASELKSTADNMNANSQKSAELMRKLRKITQDMVEQIDGITTKIHATSDAVDRISDKVTAINSISSQTNLLALNASIEAARAGEAGRGFAVVAEEISKLADDSSSAADEIRREMTELLGESQGAVKQAAEVRDATDDQMEALNDAIDSIRELVQEIEQTVVGVDQITTAATTCDESKTVVVDVMSNLSAISQENAAASEETSASMEELSATVTTLAETANQLQEVSDRLNEDMSFFK